MDWSGWPASLALSNLIHLQFGFSIFIFLHYVGITSLLTSYAWYCLDTNAKGQVNLSDIFLKATTSKESPNTFSDSGEYFSIH